MVRDSTTNQFATLILEISVAEPLRLDLWASGMLFFNFANTWVENTFGRNFLPKSTHSILQGIKETTSKQIYSFYALKHTVITEAYTHLISL